MSYTKESVDEVKNAANVLDVVGEFVSLIKNGKNYKGRCPFHNEKTPSFVVSPDKGIYHCFGCHKSGNAITFLMEYNSYTYVESLEYLSRRYGISLEEENKRQSPEITKREMVFKALDTLCYFFQEQLTKDPSQKAKTFFAKRDFTNETVKQFRLGYSPDSWDSGMKHLQNQGYSFEILEEAGLVIAKEKGNGFYDRFRDRAMFPIRDIMGRVVGFGARDLAEEQKSAKYINSPESLVYSKSKILYGLYEAKTAIRDKRFAIMTEGYADVISLHQAGVVNVVASSGTALTKEQLKLLSQYTNDIVFIFDSDGAGQKATERGIEYALEDGFNISIVNLPEGEDPDSIIRKRGKQAFDFYLDKKVNFIKFKMNLAKEKGRFDDPGEKSRATRELIEQIFKIPDALQHVFYLKELAFAANVSESTLRKIYAEKVDKDVKDENNIRQKDFQLNFISTEEENKKDKIFEKHIHKVTKGIDLAELELIHFCMQGFEYITKLYDEFNFETTYCSTRKGKKYLTILSLIENNGTNNLALELLDSYDVEEKEKSNILGWMIWHPFPLDKFREGGMIIEDYDYNSSALDAIDWLKAEQKTKEIEKKQKLSLTKETLEEKYEIANEINILKAEILKLRKMEFYIADGNNA